VAAFLMIGIVRPMRLRQVRRQEAAALSAADWILGINVRGRNRNKKAAR